MTPDERATSLAKRARRRQADHIDQLVAIGKTPTPEELAALDPGGQVVVQLRGPRPSPPTR